MEAASVWPQKSEEDEQENVTPTNPWSVDNIADFSFFCCPECIYKAKTVPDFQVHAIVNHPGSKDFFDKYSSQDHWDESDDFYNVPLKIKVEDDPGSKIELFDNDNDEENSQRENCDVKPVTQDYETGEKVELRCPKCDSMFESFSDLTNHLKDVHNVQGAKRLKNGRFACPLCDISCPNQSKLKTHVEEVHEKRKVACPQCDKLFSKGGLRNHIKYYHNVDRVSKPHKCDECDFASHALKYLKAHKSNCHEKDKRKHKCEKCGEKFPFPSHLKMHDCTTPRQNPVHRSGPVKCDDCDQVLKASQYLVNHYKKVHGRLPPGYEDKEKFMCDKCTSVFFNEWSLKQHMKSKHSLEADASKTVKPAKTKCLECDQEFNATMYYVQHYKYVHGGLPPGYENKEKFMCDQCPSVFFNQLSLKLHYKTKHSVNKPQNSTTTTMPSTGSKAATGRRKCPHCEKSFATYLSYKEHIKSKHEKDTPHKCDQCHRSYGTSGRLRVHKKNMHQRIKCDLCGQEICNVFILKRHKASVHGVTPEGVFQCEYCPSFFEQIGAKDKHVSKHHLDMSSLPKMETGY